MGRFGFPIPGRKKAPPPPITVTEPMTKAHKILGSVPLNIDSSTSWDGQSYNGSADGAEARSYTESIRRKPSLGVPSPAPSGDAWGGESAIIPSSFKNNGAEDDYGFTETSTVLRSKQSTSTLKSWYDKSKMPLSVSQQTSASAMAKGLPSKAHRMLDMDNVHTLPKSKKPNRLDLGNLIPGAWSPKHGNDTLLGTDYVTKSPSLLSPASFVDRRPRTLGKHRNGSSDVVADMGRPNTSGSSTHRSKPSHLNGLPDLYEHYEQMSFRQIMDEDLDEDDSGPAELPAEDVSIAPKATAEVISRRPQHAPPTQPLPALPHQHAPRSLLSVSKSHQQLRSGGDSESVSSRHTKTSRASITQSFNESDLQETSVLMLSSDSEEDDAFDELESTRQSIHSNRRVSRVPETMALLERGIPAGPSTPSSTAEKRMSKSSKRTSFAPSVTYLGIPSAPSSSIHTQDSQTTFTATNSIAASSTRGSIISSSSASSAPSWQTRSDKGKADAFVVALLPTKKTARSCEDVDEESDGLDLSSQRDTMMSQTDQPTPPLSPSSVDFYIRSAHSSMDGPVGHNRFMAVTRQEEMLLSALRHKRQTMRESKAGNQGAAETWEQPSQGKHLSKASDVTITNLLDFDFPAPPSVLDNSTPRAPASSSEDEAQDEFTSSGTLSYTITDEDDASPILSPIPIYPRQSEMFLKNSTYQPPEKESKRNQGGDYFPPHEALNLDDLDELIWRLGESSVQPLSVVRRPSRASSASSTRRSSHRDRRPSKLTLATSMEPVLEFVDHDEATGVPRPDSPISPSAFPMPPVMASMDKKLARLSAVGGQRMGGAPGWWDNEES